MVSFDEMHRRCVGLHEVLAGAGADKAVLDDVIRLRNDLAALRADERGPGDRQSFPEYLFNKFTANLARFGIEDGVIAEIGGSKNSFMNRLPQFTTRFLSIFPADDPNYVVADITNCPHVASESFDAVVSVSVLEHVTHLREAALEITRVLKTGGMTMHAVPFSYFFHGAPVDYWRVTTTAMENLFDELETVECYFYNANRRRNNLGSAANPIDRDGGPMFGADAFGGWRENWFTIYVGRKTADGAARAAERRWRQMLIDLVKGLTERGWSEPDALVRAMELAPRLTFDTNGLVGVAMAPDAASRVPFGSDELARLWATRSSRTVRPSVARYNLMEILTSAGLA